MLCGQVWPLSTKAPGRSARLPGMHSPHGHGGRYAPRQSHPPVQHPVGGPMPGAPSAPHPAGAARPAPPPAPVWIDMGQGRRSLWGCGAICVVVLAVGTTFAALQTSPDEPESYIWPGVLLSAALSLGLALLWRIPNVLAAQGISVDPGGISFVQKPKWWFKGRTLLVPWHKMHAMVFMGSEGQTASSDSSSEVQEFSVYLVRTPPKDLVPTWLNHSAEETETNSELGAASPFARVSFVPDRDVRVQLNSVLRSYRPDLIARQAPKRANPGAAYGWSGPHGQQPPGHQAPYGAQPHPPPIQERVSLRGTYITRWVASMFYALMVALGMGFPAILSLGSELLTDPTVILPFLPMVGFSAAALVVVAGLFAYLPQYWTTQAVDLDNTGVRIIKEPMWWFHGHYAVLDWREIHHISSHTTGSKSSRRERIEFHLHHVDHELRLPSWAKLVLGGERKWGRTATRPMVIVDLRTGSRSRRLLRALREARSDLFEENVAQRVDAQRWSQPQHPHAHGRHGHEGAWPRPSAQPQAHGYSRPRMHTAPTWVNQRTRRVVGWLLGSLVLLYFHGGLGVMLILEVLEGPNEASEWLELVPLPVGFAVFCLIWWPMLWGAPRCFTHQGVSVDGAGITLVQEPLLWFEGRTVHIPWHDIRMARTTSQGADSKILKLFLHRPGMLSYVPTGSHLSAHEDSEAPATIQQPLTRINVGGGKTAAITNAIRSTRPDLMPM